MRAIVRLVAGAAIVAACWTGSRATGYAHESVASAVPSYKNPVFKKDFPDPMVLRVNGHSYYAYGTTTGWELGYFPILHSRDLVHWKYVGDMFKMPPRWSDNDFWAPDVVRGPHGKYYGFYTGHWGAHCIAVAVASKPTGPFVQKRVIGCGGVTGNGYIDPDVFLDKGKAYLYVSVDSPQHNITVIPLTKDLLHQNGEPTALFGISQAWEHGENYSTVEGPFIVKRESTYYLFYSGNDWNGNYSMGVATSSSPLGPFTKCTCNPILHGDAKVHGPGGGSVVKGPDGYLWMVYHAWPGVEGYGPGGIRNMRIDPIQWNGAQPLVPVTP